VGAIDILFSLCYTYLYKQKGVELSNISRLLSANPADILRLEKRGAIKKGYYADIAVIDEESKFVIEDKHSPYFGKELSSKVVSLYKEGREVLC